MRLLVILHPKVQKAQFASFAFEIAVPIIFISSFEVLDLTRQYFVHMRIEYDRPVVR